MTFLANIPPERAQHQLGVDPARRNPERLLARVGVRMAAAHVEERELLYGPRERADLLELLGR